MAGLAGAVRVILAMACLVLSFVVPDSTPDAEASAAARQWLAVPDTVQRN